MNQVKPPSEIVYNLQMKLQKLSNGPEILFADLVRYEKYLVEILLIIFAL